MSWRSKKLCLTSLLPGASRKIATSAPTTAMVLTVEMAVARRPPANRNFGPRPEVPKDPGTCQPEARLCPGGILCIIGSVPENPPEPPCSSSVIYTEPEQPGYGWMVGTLR